MGGRGRDIESWEGIVVTRKRTRQNITFAYDGYSYNGFCIDKKWTIVVE